MRIIAQPLDFLGFNFYNSSPVRANGKGGYEIVPRETGCPFTAAKWPITPESLYWGPRFLTERYKVPLYITENGLSCADVVSLDGKVHDPNRIDFLHRYLRCLKKAADDGVDIRGYFHWCFTDNFEWSKGYTERFGIVHCNFETQQRIIKDSGYWYRDDKVKRRTVVKGQRIIFQGYFALQVSYFIDNMDKLAHNLLIICNALVQSTS